MRSTAILLLLSTITIAAGALSTFVARASVVEGVINSPAGLYCSTAKEEGELVKKDAATGESSLLWNGDEEHYHDFDGGFSSLDGMLQWAIGHSDPSKLKEAAKDVQRLSHNELNKRHIEIKVRLDNLFCQLSRLKVLCSIVVKGTRLVHRRSEVHLVCLGVTQPGANGKARTFCA